ncbi:MAG: class I SAM-dependent methyltransferase [Nitrososphaerota archaeon]|nr:class I SAM-dependent methyltransferase [Nitrososphaerota archaeon]
MQEESTRYTGVPNWSDFRALRRSQTLRILEEYSNEFLRANASVTNLYKWSLDPLHHWSRLWEYPYCWRILRAYSAGRTVRILDAGCGWTFFPYFLSAKLPRSTVVGCDSDSNLSQLFNYSNARMRCTVDFDVESLEELAYPDASFDVVYCISVLEHLRERNKALGELKRVLRKGGLLLLTYDISPDGLSDIPIAEARQLLERLQKEFSPVGNYSLRLISTQKGILGRFPMRTPSELFATCVRFVNRDIRWDHLVSSFGLTFHRRGFQGKTIFAGAFLRD